MIQYIELQRLQAEQKFWNKFFGTEVLEQKFWNKNFTNKLVKQLLSMTVYRNFGISGRTLLVAASLVTSLNLLSKNGLQKLSKLIVAAATNTVFTLYIKCHGCLDSIRSFEMILFCPPSFLLCNKQGCYAKIKQVSMWEM